MDAEVCVEGMTISFTVGEFKFGEGSIGLAMVGGRGVDEGRSGSGGEEDAE